MKNHHIFFTLFLYHLCILIFLKPSFSADYDTITQTQSLTDGKTLVSSGQTFELGFFSPNKSNKSRYLGIWYKATPKTIVWVANRNNPLSDSSGELSITQNQNQLVLLNSSKSVVWFSNLSLVLGAKSPVVAQLLDSGNFVLGESKSLSSEVYLWQSFDYPTDTVLAGMKLGWDLTTGFERYITSWKSDDDPSTGDYTYRLDIKGLPQLVLSMGLKKIFRTGMWNGVRFSGVYMLNYIGNSSVKYKLTFDQNVSYYMFEIANPEIVSRVTVNHSGLFQRYVLEKNKISASSSPEWALMYSRPYEPCDSYGYCGPNTVCRINTLPICNCFEGFASRSENDWEAADLSKGCKRKTALNCEKGDGFIALARLKLPDLLDFRLAKNMSSVECKDACLANCNCTAYTNSDIRRGGSGCLMWFGDLIDVREFDVEGNKQDLFLRLSASDMPREKKNLRVILIVSVLSVVGLVVIWSIIWRLGTKVRTGQDMENENIELPLFDMSAIAIATNDFSPENTIGEGGFGRVYKGSLATGLEIAVKRLSKDSRQGLKEFKNEVELIAKLQHKNLVTLLGCCIQGDERMLIYEYMPNKSLDNFAFGHRRSAALSWQKKFEIVVGVARGLLYLHHDSKLKIVHRDLKPSNILLDINMIPKISDFGLARTFKNDENEGTTRRVIGTYGYMSPEYAFNGKVSLKSDVFSFGVVLLEIVSGERNAKFNHPDHSYNLLGHAWLLWNEGKALQVMENPDIDTTDPQVVSQVLRCVHVGLLCVQKYSEDRPTMNSVVVMLANEGSKLPHPKEPGFFTETSSNEEIINESSNNGVTITQLDGR